ERRGEHRQVHEDHDHEVAEEAAQGLDREAEIDEVPVTEREPRGDRAEHERAGEEGERVEHGGGGEDWPEAAAAGAHGERGESEGQRDDVRAGAPAPGVAPQGREVDGGGEREERPHAQLGQAGGARLAGAQEERDLAGDEERRAADEDGRGRLVEAALEQREGWHREAEETADGELPEDEQETVAEVRHRLRPTRPPRPGPGRRAAPRKRPAGRPPPPRAARRASRAMTPPRRFSARPSAVALLATGFAFPNPRVVIRLALIPFSTMRLRTVSARRSD